MTLPFIINSALVLAACLAFYKVLLHRETFYRANRYLLIACLLISFSLPLVRVPNQFSLRPAAPAIRHKALPDPAESKPASPSVNNYSPLSAVLPVPAGESATVQNGSKDAVAAAGERTDSGFSFSMLLNGLFLLYWFGVAVLTGSFLFQLALLLWRTRRNTVIADGYFRIVEMTGEQAPCSFGRYIFVNPALYDRDTYQQILFHEKIHIRQNHSLDILFAEFVVILQWFNPFAWLYRREVENNLEFLTDDQMMRVAEIDKKSYQLSLLRVSAPQLPLRVTSNYNQSMLKKRIAMMNKKRSNQHTAWKYLFLLPLLVALACLLNEPQAQNPEPQSIPGKAAQHNISTQTSPSTPYIPPATPNSTLPQNASRPPLAIHSSPMAETPKRPMQSEGFWFAVIKGNDVNIQFSDEKITGESDWSTGHRHNSSNFKLSELSEIPRGQAGTFHISREAGKMEFNGKFDGNSGMGTYSFQPNKEYVSFMNRELDNTLSDDEQLAFFVVDVTRAYLQMLHKQGYAQVGKDEILPLCALKVDEAFIQSIRQSGFRDISMKNLIPFRALGINGAYITEIRDAGFKDISADKLIAFKAQGIDKAYINKVRQMRGTGEGSNDEDAIITFKALNINEDFMNSYKQVGYDKIPNDQLVAFKSLGVTPAYIKSWQHAGFPHLKPEHLVALKSQGITPEYQKAFSEVGYANIDPEHLVAFKALGITPEYIRSFQNAGYKHITVEQLPALKSQNITPEYIRSFESVGFNNIGLDEIVAVRALGVTPDYIREMRAKGFDYNSIQKYVTLKSLN